MKFKKQKQILILSAVFILVIMLASFNLAADSSCKPKISLVNQDPTPADPNSYVKVVFEVSGLLDCDGFAVKLDPKYPFSIDPDVNPVQTIDKFSYLPNYKSTWTVPYKIRVAQDAFEGEYQLGMLYHVGTNQEFGASEGRAEFNISITDTQTDFDVVVQGVSNNQVSLGVVNTGKNTANSLVVGIPKQDSFRTTSSSEQIVGNLAAGDYTIVTFSITQTIARNMTQVRPQNINFSASQNNQLLNVQLDYTDSIGKRRSIIKELEMDNLLSLGNISGTNFRAGQRATTTSSSSSKTWWYVLGIAIIIILAYLYRDKIKSLYKKTSKNAPDWVLAERTRHKK